MIRRLTSLCMYLVTRERETSRENHAVKRSYAGDLKARPVFLSRDKICGAPLSEICQVNVSIQFCDVWNHSSWGDRASNFLDK